MVSLLPINYGAEYRLTYFSKLQTPTITNDKNYLLYREVKYKPRDSAFRIDNKLL